MATICENFVQNAWRKDLCSNCFKLKQDHHVCSKTVDTYNEKYIHQETTVYHSTAETAKVQGSSWKGMALQKNFVQNGFFMNGVSSSQNFNGSTKTNGFIEKFEAVPTSILKNGHRKSSTGSVGFREEDPQVIGYGGELEPEHESEDEDSDQFEDCDSLENFDVTEEDQEFMKLTEKNTEFNSLHRNLLAPSAEEKTATVAKYNSEGGSSVCVEKEVISKPVDVDEEQGGNRFQLPRATIRPFCRESVSSILDAKATAASLDVHYDENGHIVINEMNGRNFDEREVVAYEVSPVTKIAPEGLESMFMSSDLPPELPSSPPPDELEQPLANSTYKVKNTESFYCSTAIVFDSVSDDCLSVEKELNAVEKQVKVKPVVPSKPKSRTPECCGLNSDSDSSSIPSSEEIYQDTREVCPEAEDKKELSFKDKVANLHNNLDFNKKNTKRQAPLPPLSSEVDEKESKAMSVDPTNMNTPISVILRNPPVKRVNSSSSDVEEQETSTPSKPTSPPVPRKPATTGNTKLRTCHSLDVSSTRILATPMPEDSNKKLKGKFSLKKLLKFGKDGEDSPKNKPYPSTTLEKKMKLEILHPMDLANLPSSNPTSPSGDWDSPLVGEAGTFAYINEDKMMSSSPESPKSPSVGVTRVKPPPPPRIKAEIGAQLKPLRPPPPFKGSSDSSTPVMTSPETKEKNRNKAETNVVDLVPSAGGEYANLGEVRVIIAPRKPERNSPATMRKEQKQDLIASNEDEDKVIAVNDGKKELSPEHLYCEPPDSLVNSMTDDISETSTLKASSPVITKVSRYSRNAKAIGMVFPDSGFAEVSSTESDAASISSGEGQCPSPKVELSNLYAEVNKKDKTPKLRQIKPDDVAPPPPPAPRMQRIESSSTDDNDSSNTLDEGSFRETVSVKGCQSKWKKCLGLRANCSGIRGTMEENYNALVTANHEALAKLVQQTHAKKNLSCFDGLLETPLRWTDFKVEPTAMAKIQNTAFYSAIWGKNTEVMLLVSEDIFPIPIPAKAPFLLSPIATFQDFIPLDFENNISEKKLSHRMIWVFAPVKVQTLETFSTKLKTLAEEDLEGYTNLLTFLLLQLISALKHLQADGTEEVGYPPDWVVLMGNEEEDCTDLSLSLIGSTIQSFPHPDSNCYSLCSSALAVMRLLLTGEADSGAEDICKVLPDNVAAKTTFRVVIGILENEKANSLSRVEDILEFALYGPTINPKHHEAALQRWLDLEKAFALNNLICCVDRGEQTVFQDFHLRFLTRTNSKRLRDALSLLTCSKA